MSSNQKLTFLVVTPPIVGRVNASMGSTSGYSSNDNDKSKWAEFNQVRRDFFYSKNLNDYIEELGLERYPNDIQVPETRMLTVYAYPEELNYPMFSERKDWFNLECFNKNSNQEQADLDPKFVNDTLNGKWSGKWIYFSLGTMGSVDVELMNRLLSILSNTNHKYVVSKGPKHEQIVLGSNMIGDRYVDQTRILPSMDLVITHGGNNTVGETMTHGKPMIVFPLFVDQFDNAQRIHETGFGIRLDPYKCTGDELLNAINQLLNDKKLSERMKNVSKRMRNSNRSEQLCDLIEQLLSKHVKLN
ncbi:hypothetical protein RDWZM_007885 [Blomia tropicalis]|uniref:Uncharacterized protein n=1 Tax=Blomia tropicalis TaxID=40697 RepID=A0A9Q0RID5_BLOTA|nr:hypothetical protein RDWZM_007885 [Blomia tropicalis]